MQPARVTFAGYLELVRSNHNFRRLWLAQIVSEIGDWFYSVAIFSFLLDTVGTAESVALAFLCQVLPQTLVSPAAGVINDRLSRRRVMLFADWSRVVIVGCMLLVRGRDTVWLLYTLLVLETVMWALFEPGNRLSYRISFRNATFRRRTLFHPPPGPLISWSARHSAAWSRRDMAGTPYLF